MKQQKLTVRLRNGIGRGHSRRIRAGGEVPAVIYGRHKEPQALAVDGQVLGQLLKSIGGSASVLEIETAGASPRLSVIAEVQRNPITNEILHLDLHEVDANETMDVTVTVHTAGTAFGVKNENGVIELVSHDLSIRCLPGNLPEYIVVDVSEMHVDDTLHVSDLKAIEGVEFLDDPDQAVVSCVPAVAEVEEVTAEAEVAPGEVPVVGEEKEAPEEAEGAAAEK